MSTVTLSDGTIVPKHYDFNEHFEPLVVKNQGQQGICWPETRCTMLEAFWRMYTDLAPTFDPNQIGHADIGWAVSDWTDNRFDPPHPLGRTTYIGGDEVNRLAEYSNLSKKEAIVKALWTNGVLEGGTKAEHSMNRLYRYPQKYPEYNQHTGKFSHIPVLHILPGDLIAVHKNNWAHATIYVGYDWDKGILFQNSWGSKFFGKAGRAYNGWDMVDKDVVDAGFIHTFNDNLPNSFKMPPKRAA